MVLTDEKGINPFERREGFYFSLSKADSTFLLSSESVFPIIIGSEKIIPFHLLHLMKLDLRM